MTGLEKIVKQIQDEAQQAADAVISQAKAEAASLLEKARADAAVQTAAAAQKSQSAVANALAAAKSAAELARRRALLFAKQEIIGEVIDTAQRSIYSLPDSDYFDMILRMAARFTLPQEGEILFSAADLKRLPVDFEARLQTASKGSLRISKAPRAIDGGFVLVYGGVEENCSIEALFYAAREELQDQVQELLFSENCA